jgi:thioredoxin reductase (NADPH)
MSELTGDRQDAAPPAAPTAQPGEPAAETPDIYGCYPRLSSAQIDALAALGSHRPTAPGEVLFREGDPSCDFFVVSAGKVAVVEGHATPEEQVIGVHGPGRFLGELSLLTGEMLPITAVTLEPGEVVQVPIPGPPLDADRPRRRGADHRLAL